MYLLPEELEDIRMEYQMTNNSYQMVLTNYLIINRLDSKVCLDSGIIKYVELKIDGKQYILLDSLSINNDPSLLANIRLSVDNQQLRLVGCKQKEEQKQEQWIIVDRCDNERHFIVDSKYRIYNKIRNSRLLVFSNSHYIISQLEYG